MTSSTSTTPSTTSPGPDVRPPIRGRKAALILVGLLAVAAAVAALGIILRLNARASLQEQTNALAAPDVLVARPQLGEPSRELVLPGNVQAFTDSPIYARTSGYLQKWYFDIGARVKKGQRLAVIASPEVDQQLAAARAELATARSTSKNAQIQSARYADLLKDNAVSKQDADNFATLASSGNTQVAAAAANVQRLLQLIGFESVEAPFDGTITARNVDVGTLIQAGASRELFHLADEDILRIYVNVPQVYARACVPGVSAGVNVAEFPGRTFEGKIVRTSRTIDPASRTLLVEVDVDNHGGDLFPGAFCQVHFKLNAGTRALVLPVPTLMFRSEGLRVAVIRGDDKVKLVPITIGRDDGRTVEVVEGLQPSDLVVQNPPDSLIDGETVHVVQAQPSGSSADGGAPGRQDAGG
jgi:RND family efflux transporter MFP subunit